MPSMAAAAAVLKVDPFSVPRHARIRRKLWRPASMRAFDLTARAASMLRKDVIGAFHIVMGLPQKWMVYNNGRCYENG